MSNYKGWADAIERIGKMSREKMARQMAEEAAEARPMSEWQPIETAPRDGEKILVSTDSGSINVVRWSDEAEFEQCSTAPGWQIWACEDCWYSVALEFSEATHWMPLPPPPSSRGEPEEK